MAKLILFHRRLAAVTASGWDGVWRGPYREGLARLPGSPTIAFDVPAEPDGFFHGVDEISWADDAAARAAVEGPWLRYLIERIGSLEQPGWPRGGLVEERVLVPPPPAGRGVKRMAPLLRRADLDADAFARYWADRHGPTASALPGLIGYVQAAVVAPVGRVQPVDGVAILWFDDRAAADQAFASAAGRRAQADNAAFLDVAKLGATYVAPRDWAAAALDQDHDGGWTNWSGSVRCRPARIERPRTEAEVAEMVRSAAREGLGVRVAGTGHSFVPLCASDGLLLSLDRLSGVVSVDRLAGEATVWGGTTIHDLGPLLRERGLGMENMGDIDRQTIAGAVSTGTHGTGLWFGNISSQVVALTLVSARGDVVECSRGSDPELFACARVALGALGVITRVRLRLLPAYRLHDRRWDWPFARCMQALDRMIADNHHFEFFWNPRSDLCAMKTLNPTDREPGEPAPGERIDWSDLIFPSERTFRFNEMEFAVPAPRGPDCLHELRALMRERHSDVAWPIEYRTVEPDDIPLSPAFGRETVTISVHQAAELDHRPFFRDAETIFRAHQGRPHWGKMHTHGAAELRALYPEWERFQATRRRVDPDGRFLNEHLRAVLGA